MGAGVDRAICRTNLSQAGTAWAVFPLGSSLPYGGSQQLRQHGGLNLSVPRIYDSLVFL